MPFPQTFSEGVIVRLKSGGPPMTTEATLANGLVGVAWFDGPYLSRDALHPEALIQNPQDQP